MRSIADRRPATTLWQDFGIPVLMVGLTLILKHFLVEIFIEVGNSFLIFFTTVVLAANWGGKTAGRVSVGLSALANLYIFIPPQHSWHIEHFGDGMRLFIFVLEALFASDLTTKFAVALRNAEALSQASLRQQELLRSSEEKFCQMTDVIQDVFWMRDLDSNQILYVSPAYEQIWGYSCTSLYADASHWLNSIHPDDRDRVQQTFFANPFRGCDLEYRIIRADGLVRWIRDRALPIQNSNGQNYRMTGLAEDITERKQAEAQLQLAYVSLEQRVIDRTQELSEVNAMLKRRIAAHQQTEQALLDSEEQLQLALEASGDGLWDWNIITGEDYLSPQWLAMLGYEVGELPGHASTWEALVHPEDKPWVIDLLQQHMLDGQYPYKFDYRMLTKSGDWKWIANYGKVVSRDQDGLPLRMVGIHRDIHYQRLAQAALAKSERRLQYLVSSSPAVIFSCQPDCGFKMTYMSENVSDILGYSADAFLTNAQFWIDHVHPDDRAYVHQKAQQLIPHEFNFCEYRFLHQDGRYRWLWAKVRSLLNEASGDFEVIGSLVDITERVQLEHERQKAVEALEESEATLWSFYNSAVMRMGIVELTNDDLFHISVNQAAATALGRTPEELKYLPASQEGRSLEFRQRWIEQYRKSETLGKPVHFEYAQDTPTGDQEWLSCTVCPVYPAPDLRSRFSYIVEDITARKAAEAKISKSLHEKEVLLKEIHHRVKNNLQIICSLLWLQAQFVKDNPGAIAALKDSQDRIQSMALVHETLYRSGILSEIKMADYVQTLVHNLSQSYLGLDSHIQLSTQVDPEILIDLDQSISLGLIISELVCNSLKHAFTSRTQGQIEIQMLLKSEDQVCLMVKDNGQGLPADFNLNQSKTLGLTLVQDLINQLDGTLAIHSSSGTQFMMTFPQHS
jgi:PAS domain S-box-containing protein